MKKNKQQLKTRLLLPEKIFFIIIPIIESE